MKSVYGFMRRHPSFSEFMAMNAAWIPIVGTVSCVSAIIFKLAVKNGYVEHERRPYTSVRRLVNNASIGGLALLAIPCIGPLSYLVYLVAQERLCQQRDLTHNVWRDCLSRIIDIFESDIKSKQDWNTPEGLRNMYTRIIAKLVGSLPRGLGYGYPIDDKTRARLDKSFEDDEVIAILEDLQTTYENLINVFEENLNSQEQGLDIKIDLLRSFRFSQMRNYEEAVSTYRNIIQSYQP